MRPLLRSMLFVPGDQARMIEKARTLPADAIILDLEDGVAPKDKVRARVMVHNALMARVPGDRSVWLRPNALATGLLEDDLLACVLPGLTGVVLPKSRAAADVALVDGVLRVLERSRALSGRLLLALLIETPQAVLDVEEIARASARIAALLFGADDLAAEAGLARTERNDEVGVARAHVALAAHARGCGAIDLVHAKVRDLEGLTRECREGKALVHAVFSPSQEEIVWARRIVDAYRAAPRGALVVDGRMVDAPIVAQAERLLHVAGRIAAQGGAGRA